MKSEPKLKLFADNAKMYLAFKVIRYNSLTVEQLDIKMAACAALLKH